jgi:hypothetical protein
LEAIGRYRKADFAGGQDLLSQSARIEKGQGEDAGSQHTIHEGGILSHYRGDLNKAAEYYRDTFKSVKKLRNAQGMALCLRSLGDIAYVLEDLPHARNFWTKSMHYCETAQMPEAATLRKWLQSLEETDGNGKEEELL